MQSLNLNHWITREVLSYGPLYFCGAGCNFFFISDFIDLDPFPLLLYESVILPKTFKFCLPFKEPVLVSLIFTKVLILMKSNLFFENYLCFDIISKKPWLNLMSQRFTPIFCYEFYGFSSYI